MEILFFDEENIITGFQVFPEKTPIDRHIKVNIDDVFVLNLIIGNVKLNDDFSLPEITSDDVEKWRISKVSEDQRIKRNSLLLNVDEISTNILRWSELSDQEKYELSEYRLGLLNVPQQAGFPEGIEWPPKPLILEGK